MKRGGQKMLYIIRVLSMRSDRHSYDLYETHTESVIKATKEIILELIGVVSK